MNDNILCRLAGASPETHAPLLLAGGDRVIVTIHDWMTGEHELPATVRRIDPTGRVVVDAGAGTQTLRLSCHLADVRLVEEG